MTRTTNARIAGVTFLFYIATGITTLVLFGRAASGDDMAAKLASIAEHGTEVRITLVLYLLMSLSAIVLGVTLHALTRDEDADLAMLGLACRLTEGILSATGIASTLALLALATASAAGAPETAAAHALAGFLMTDSVAVTATFFAVGSALFSYLLLRGRMIPAALAWLGVIASLLLVACLPLQLAGLLRGLIPQLAWLPMLVFELAFALWLIVKGVAPPARAAQGQAGLDGGSSSPLES
jgi:hypothetical protein